MSAAKVGAWALVGIAVGQGRIGSVGDPITRYWYTATSRWPPHQVAYSRS